MRAPQDWVLLAFVVTDLCTYVRVLYVLFIPIGAVRFYLCKRLVLIAKETWERFDVTRDTVLSKSRQDPGFTKPAGSLPLLHRVGYT